MKRSLMIRLFTLSLIVSAFCLAGMGLAKVESAKKNPIAQLSQGVARMDSASVQFNGSPKGPARVEKLLSTYENMSGRKFSVQERKFLMGELINAEQMPRFESTKDSVIAYANGPQGRQNILTLQVVDPAKNIFKYNGQTVTLNPGKNFLQNLQMVVQGVEKPGRTR